MIRKRILSVIGLGYVGLPIAACFARAGFSVVAYDNDSRRIDELRDGVDRTREVKMVDVSRDLLWLTDNAEDLAQADFHIVTVPTPIDGDCNPDMGFVLDASRILGRILKSGDVVVYESTVYPGATESECIPVLEGESGLRAGKDFGVGYSPERINPGDGEHRFESIRKVIAAGEEQTLDIMEKTYGAVVRAGLHRAPNIRTAEAAKVIENAQRDINIAFMNELSMIFERIDVDTRDVLEAASTKWNFLPFTPGLVGGHCIGVDPYYLTHRARRAGIEPAVILSGRRINDGMGRWVAGRVAEWLRGRAVLEGAPVVTVLGVTFKENIPDVRNSLAVDLIRELEAHSIRVQAADPEADPYTVQQMYDIPLISEADLEPADAVIVAVGHRHYASAGWLLIEPLLRRAGGLVADLKGVLDRKNKPVDTELWRL